MTCIVGCLVPVFRPYSEWYHVHQSYLQSLFQHNTMPHTSHSCKPPQAQSTYSLNSVYDWTLLSSPPLNLVMVVPGAGVITMAQFTLESLAPSVDHSGSFTVTLATVHSLAGQGHPGTPASGHRDTGLAWPGLAGLSLPPLTVTDTLARAALTTGPRPQEQTAHKPVRSSYFAKQLM